MKYQCPNCHKTIFNRRIKCCEFCGEVLPTELLLTDEDKKKLNREYLQGQVGSAKQEIDSIDPPDVFSPKFAFMELGDTTFIGMPRPSRKCIKCHLTIPNDVADCPNCFGKPAEAVPKVRNQFYANLSVHATLGKWFWLMVVVLIMLLVLVIY